MGFCYPWISQGKGALLKAGCKEVHTNRYDLTWCAPDLGKTVIPTELTGDETMHEVLSASLQELHKT